MKTFTGWEYLLIDAANQYGWDKKIFEVRIQWVLSHLHELEAITNKADNKPLYAKAVMAIRKAQQGIATGHMVGFDAVCSGIQVMSALTGCISGARATGLVDPDVRADAYTQVTDEMRTILGTHFTVSRDDAKQALMTSFYGSKKEPINIFGEDTPELNAFYQAAQTTAPGAWELLQDLLASWKPMALSHEWILPDGFDARVKVMERTEARIEVDELDHATFTYQFYENKGKMKGLSNVANVVHSVDAYVLRCIHRRCNYDRDVVEDAALVLEMALIARSMGEQQAPFVASEDFAYYCDQYDRSGMADVVMLPYLNDINVSCLSTEHLQALATIVNGMLEYTPFEVVAIHDEFKCHPNNMNHLRQQYINVLAELSESKVLDDILGQLHGGTGTFNKLSTNLGAHIRGSNYALC